MDWRTLNLNRTSPLPLYYQLAESVQDHIRRGSLVPGDQLPAERHLAESVGISRMTARQAVAHLVTQGALEVQHGIGTFVAEPKLTYDPSHLRGFSEEMLQRGGAVSSTVLEQSVVMPSQGVATSLSIPLDEPVLKLVRIRSLNNLPLLLETSFVLQRQCPMLVNEDLQSGSLYTILADRCGLRVHHAEQTIEAVVADDVEAEIFSIAVGTPMLLLEGTAFTETDEPVEYFRAAYRGDRFKFALGQHDSARTLYGSSPPLNLVLT